MWFYSAIQEVLPLGEDLANKIQSFCIDSRKAVPNSLFFALKGERVNGHAYLEEAKEKGAIAAVVEEGFKMDCPPLHLIYCKDVQETLQKAAHQVILFWKPKIIGITGSLGKTSTKDFLNAILSKYFSIQATPGNYNTQLTLPLTILNTEKPSDYLLLEMGLDRPNEIDRLLDIAPPDIAILTMLAHVHIEAFGAFENLAQEKMKIFERDTQCGFYNLDMPFSDQVEKKGRCKKISYSLKDKSADYFLEKNEDFFEVYKNQTSFLKAPTPFFDFKSHYNLLAAIAVADFLNVPVDVIKEEIPNLKHAKNRLQKIEKNGVLFILDAYNANLDSNENALMSLPQNISGRKIAILAEMVDQGEYAVQNHQELSKIALQYVDHLIGFGPQMHVMRPIWKKSKKKWAFFLSYPNMLAYISKFIQKGDVVLLKGSRKFALERILNDITLT